MIKSWLNMIKHCCSVMWLHLEVKNLKPVLRWFEVMSGLKRVMVGVEDMSKRNLDKVEKLVWYFHATSWLFIGWKTHVQSYRLMIEKFERKLAIQKCKYFFSWMKNHSLFIYLLTSHSVFIFCIYSVSGERIKKLQRDFPWDKNDGKKKIHLN